MTAPIDLAAATMDLDGLAALTGRLTVFLGGATGMGPAARRLDRLTRGALRRMAASPAFEALKPGEGLDLAFPAGVAAEALQVIRITRRADAAAWRKAGAAIARGHGTLPLMVLCDLAPAGLADLALGLLARAYDFSARKSAAPKTPGPVTLAAADPAVFAAPLAEARARAEALFFTRDLVNEPANILTTFEFAERLKGLSDLGVAVEVLEEDDLAHLGMGALLGVGQGSESPSKVVVMQWKGTQGDAPPLALVGKGVVFDTGGISIKGASGMEEMTMDMGGAGVVAGVMKLLALRKSPAHVVGLVGIVENMPSGRAQRPGDVVTTMKGDTVEVINTDAEGRLVLADVLWYTQERFKPAGIIDLATLTGAIIVALGTENAGVFSNDDALAGAFLKAAKAEGEAAWRMPMGQAYDDKLKSRIADMMNVGGREGGAITAAQFIARFIKPDQPWVHLDIAGVTLAKTETVIAPKGATGWGVLSLDRLIRDRHEPKA
jgi:leucyl aminopeptidase